MKHTIATNPVLHIDLPDNLIIAAVSIDPFYRLGLLGLLPQMHMICFVDDPLTDYLISHGLPVLSLKRSHPDVILEKQNTESILRVTKLVKEIRQLGELMLYVYKNTAGVTAMAQQHGLPLIANSYELAGSLENKYTFRQLLKDAPFAPYQTIKKVDIAGNERQYYRDLIADLGEKLVVQDDVLSGGKGTYIIRSESDWNKALSQLLANEGGEWLVVSKFVSGVISSVQVCITKYGAISTGWQQQVISNPTLCNTQVGGVEQFCGGVWSDVELSETLQVSVVTIVDAVATQLRGLGYKGIFGIDLITDLKQNKIYLIEVNARVTGMTPMLTLMQKAEGEVPLQLLHVLELGNFDYTADAPERFNEYQAKSSQGSFLVLHNKTDHSIILKKPLRVGVYRYSEDGKCEWVREGYELAAILNENELLIPDPPSADRSIEPYQRSMCIITKECEVDVTGTINGTLTKVIQYLENLFI